MGNDYIVEGMIPKINKVLNEDLSIQEKLQKLVYKCNNRGGNDNISIAYLVKDGVNQ